MPLLTLKDSRAFSRKDSRVTQCDPNYKVLQIFFYKYLFNKYILIGKNMQFILLKKLTQKQQQINLVIWIYFSFCVTLLVLHQ